MGTEDQQASEGVWLSVARLLFLDIETTGLDPRIHAPIQLGAVWTDDNIRVLADGTAKYLTYIRPFKGAKIDKSAMQTNQIDLKSSDFRSNAISNDTVVRKLDALTETYCRPEVPFLSGWNISFDVSFLRLMYERCRSRQYSKWRFPSRTLDVQAISAFMQGLKFESLSAHAGIRHSALDDIELTLERLRELLKQRNSLRSLIVRKLNYGRT
jgi:oligoribonuclease (3'-5' exoribonuclease)